MKKLPLYFAILMLAIFLLSILAPIFAHFKIYFLSTPIYWMFQWICHQRPWRSYHIFDYQYAIDARMTTLFLSLGIGGLLSIFYKLEKLSTKLVIFYVSLMLLPMAIDGFVQLFAEIGVLTSSTALPFYESTNLIRSITGIFAGLGISISLFPYLDPEIGYAASSIKYIKPTVIGIFLSLLVIPIIVMFWSLTSTKYLPSSFFIDNTRRFPGYNYEVTTNGGHSTNDRIIKEPTTRYEEREQYYKRK